jgi:hypothetical protein
MPAVCHAHKGPVQWESYRGRVCVGDGVSILSIVRLRVVIRKEAAIVGRQRERRII